MKLRPLTACLLVITALRCFAQDPAPPPAPASKPSAGSVLERAVFSDVSLPEMIEFLDKKETEIGGPPLNVVLAPGLEDLRIPALSLRNVRTTEVLAISASLLGLKLEPVPGDKDGTPVAWLLKPQASPASAAPPGTASASTVPGGPGTVITLASTAEPATAARQSRVFGIGALLPKPGPSAESVRDRNHRMGELLEQLLSFAKEQDAGAELRAYPELDLVVVKTSAMPLMEQAIEAMSKDAATKALAAAEGRAIEATGKAAEQQAMHLEANQTLRALQLEATLREKELQEKIDNLTRELESLHSPATPRK